MESLHSGLHQAREIAGITACCSQWSVHPSEPWTMWFRSQVSVAEASQNYRLLNTEVNKELGEGE